jgi:hypothetical protein
MGHSAGSGSTLLATAQIPILRYRPLCSISFELDTDQITLHPHARGHVSTCAWLCITHAPCHISTWSRIHVHVAVYPHAEFSYSLWALVQNIVKLYSPQSRILLCAHATAQNFVMCYKPTGQNSVKSYYGPRSRIIDQSADSQEPHIKACSILLRHNEPKKLYM